MMDQHPRASELQRRFRVADTMVTMHSICRDEYARRALILDAVVFLSSIVIAALAFLDPDLIGWLPWQPESSRIVIGTIAIITFFASVMAWRVDWKGKADAHGRAATAYAKAKFSLRAIDPEAGSRDIDLLIAQYEEVSSNTIAIPDSKFLALKSEHLLKVQVSRTLDRCPGAWVRLVKLRIRMRHTCRAFGQESN